MAKIIRWFKRQFRWLKNRNRRHCFERYREITACFGCMIADYNDWLDGKIPASKVRERCGVCQWKWNMKNDEEMK
jgi:hypothetical protein